MSCKEAVKEKKRANCLNKGLELLRSGKYSDAIDFFFKAIETNPLNSWAYFHRGNAHFKLIHYKQALADYNKAIQFNPRHAMAYYNRGNTKNRLQQYKAAIVDFDRAIQLDPKDAEAYYNRARVKEIKKDAAKAEKEINEGFDRQDEIATEIAQKNK